MEFHSFQHTVRSIDRPQHARLIPRRIGRRVASGSQVETKPERFYTYRGLDNPKAAALVAQLHKGGTA